MNISYDSEADAAYISLVDTIGPGEAAQQISFIDTPNGESQVNLDFDIEAHRLGVEILVASRALPGALLAVVDTDCVVQLRGGHPTTQKRHPSVGADDAVRRATAPEWAR